MRAVGPTTSKIVLFEGTRKLAQGDLQNMPSTASLDRTWKIRPFHRPWEISLWVRNHAEDQIEGEGSTKFNFQRIPQKISEVLV